MKRCAACQSSYPPHYTHCPNDGNLLGDPTEWSEGTIVRGKYRILAKVGQGGMGAVYKAIHLRFKEVRALKVISPKFASDITFVRRFEQEAIITRMLQHPNAVEVDDIDEAEDGRPFIVMEYIEGRSLKDAIQQEAPMATARVCSIAKQVAAALDAAHTLGLVHRDIKPENIALVRAADEPDFFSDRVKVLDFGIAKLKEAHVENTTTVDFSLTGTGMAIGTPAYMSPEQARGLKGDQLDGRSDLYSLGIVMYQMLTGELPFSADSPLELAMARVSTSPKPIQEARPDVRIPDALARLVMRCVETNRESRPASGAALIQELELASGASTEELAPLDAKTQREGSAIPIIDQQVPSKVTQQRPKLRLGMWPKAAAALLISGGLGLMWRFHYVERDKPQTEFRAPKADSDGDIKSEVLKALSVLNNSSLQVSVQNGTVTLSGTVGSPSDHDLATRLAAAVKGVRYVRNDTSEQRAHPEAAGPPHTLSTSDPNIGTVSSERTFRQEAKSSGPRGTTKQASEGKIPRLIAAGYQATDNGAYDSAIADFQSVLDVDPHNASAQEGLLRARRAKQTEESVLNKK